jgi:hypothetical protein
MLNAVNVKSFAALAASSGRAAAARQRAANCTAVALAGLAGLSPLAKRVRDDGSDKLAEKVLHLASCMLEDQVRLGWVVSGGIMASCACVPVYLQVICVRLCAVEVLAGLAGLSSLAKRAG